MLFLLFLVFVLFAWISSLRGQLKALKKKYSPILDVERYAKAAKDMADKDLGDARAMAASIVANARTEKSRLEQKVLGLSAQAQEAQADLDLIDEALKLKSDDAYLLEVGYYEPVYAFEDLPRYEAACRD